MVVARCGLSPASRPLQHCTCTARRPLAQAKPPVRLVECAAAAVAAGGGDGSAGGGSSGGSRGGSGGGDGGNRDGSPSNGSGGWSNPLLALLPVAGAQVAKQAEARQLLSRPASLVDVAAALGDLATALASMGLGALLITAAAAAVGRQSSSFGPAGSSTGSASSVDAGKPAAAAALSEAAAASPDCSSAAADTASSSPVASAARSSSSAEPSPSLKRIVLFVEPSPFTYTSGYQTRFQATIKEMVAAGCSVLVITPGRGAAGLLPGGQRQPLEFEGARVVEAGSFPCPGYSTVPLSLGISPRIFNEVRSWNPDLIHCTSPGALPVGAWLYSRLLRVPLVASFHTHVPSYLPKLGMGWLVGGAWGYIRTIHRAAHLTIAVSANTATDLIDAGACDPKALKVWPKAVDCVRFHPEHACQEMRRRLESDHSGHSSSDSSSSSSKGPLLLYVGRVSSEKNLELLRGVLERVPGARLAIVGDGPAMERMKEHFAGTPTLFVGQLKGAQLAAAYASADIFVFPSASETLGNVVGEAMASGLPVVAAAAGGVPSVIGKPGVAGLLFPPGDAEAAAGAVQRLVADPAARKRISLAAREEMERWSWRRATQEIMQEHYPAALAASRPAPSAPKSPFLAAL